MSRPTPHYGTGLARVADLFLDAPRPLLSREVAERAGVCLRVAQHYLTALCRDGRVVRIGASSTARWVSPANAAAAQAEHDAARAVKKYPRKKRLTPLGQWRSGQPIRVVSTEWAAGEAPGPNSVFALGAAVQA